MILSRAGQYTKPVNGTRLNRSHPLAKGLVAYWLFHERSGFPYNLVGGPYGTLTGGPFWTGGKSGAALSFDGTDDFVDLGSPTNLGLAGDQAFTLSVLAKPSATRLDGSFVSYGSAAGNRVISINSNGAGAIYSVHFGNDNAFATPWTLGQWQWVALAYDPATSTEKLYVNGVYKEQWTPANLALLSNEIMHIARATWNGIFVNTTLIDEVRLYNRALSEMEIQHMHSDPYACLLSQSPNVKYFLPAVAPPLNFTVILA